MILRLVRVAPLAAMLLALLLFPLVGQEFYIELVAKIMILAIFAMSLQLLVGHTGLVSFGHAAYYGIGAYTLALMMPTSAAASFWWLLPAAVAAAALAAFVIGLFVLRTRGIYFIMVTLAFAQMAFYLFHDTGLGGGSDGIYVNFKPVAAIFGWRPFNFENSIHLYYVVLTVAAVVYVFLRRLMGSAFGRALAGIRSNEHRMTAMGFDTFRYKLGAFTVAGALAGLAGFLNATLDSFVTPELMAWHQSGNVLLVIILGGIGSLTGAVLGAFAFVAIQEFFQGMFSHWQLFMGGFIVLVVFFLPGGLAAIPDRVNRMLVKGKRHD